MVPTWTWLSGTSEGITPFSYAGFRPFLNRTQDFNRCVLDASSFLYWTWTQNLKKNAGLEPIFNMYAGFAVLLKAYSGLKGEGVIPPHGVLNI